MPRRAPTLLLVAALALCCSALCGVASAGALSFVPCAGASAAGFECATLPVPVEPHRPRGRDALAERRAQTGRPDPSGDRRRRARRRPGQAALPLAEFIAKAIAPALGSRDLLVFDQRGTGASDPLSCRALRSFERHARADAVRTLRAEIGPARGGFTTQESVEDIEALRVAGGYEKLVLYGTSYGTKVALEYAERYPQNVEALVLDSVVQPNGPEPLTSTASRRSPGSSPSCARTAPARASPATPRRHRAPGRAAANARAQRLGLRRLGQAPHAHDDRARACSAMLEAGDLNPALRALLPAAVARR